MSAGENISIITISLVGLNNVSMCDDDPIDMTCSVITYRCRHHDQQVL
jgi:hypothetical protein